MTKSQDELDGLKVETSTKRELWQIKAN